MRIIAGKYKHRLISWPDDAKHIRPTKDRIREAIFSALGPIDNLTALDLYSGSGAMGIEALSRGCSFVTFVDCNKVAIQTTKNNLKSLDIKNANILEMKDIDAINLFIKNKKSFDIVFLDPPYKEGKYEEIISLLVDNNLLNDNAIIVLEADHDVILNDSFYKKRKDYKYGDIKVSILWR